MKKRIVIVLSLALTGVASVSAMDADEMAAIEDWEEERSVMLGQQLKKQQQQAEAEYAMSKAVPLLEKRPFLRPPGVVEKEISHYYWEGFFCYLDGDTSCYFFVESKGWWKLVPSKDSDLVLDMEVVKRPVGAMSCVPVSDIVRLIAPTLPRTPLTDPFYQPMKPLVILEGDEESEEE